MEHKTREVHFPIAEYVNMWRWMKQKHAGRRLWCGRENTGTGWTKAQAAMLKKVRSDPHHPEYHERVSKAFNAGTRKLIESDGTNHKTFDLEAETKWAATPDAERLLVLQAAFKKQSGPPGLGLGAHRPTMAGRLPKTLRPKTVYRPIGISGTWEDTDTQRAALNFEKVLDAITRACHDWADGNGVSNSDWVTITSVKCIVEFLCNSKLPPSPSRFDGIQFSGPDTNPNVAIGETWQTVIQEATQQICSQFLLFLTFARAGEGLGFKGRLKRCSYLGCGDFFVGTGNKRRCAFHSNSTAIGSGKNRQASGNKSYLKHKAAWDATTGNRVARAKLIAKTKKLNQTSKKIKNFLQGKGADCSYSYYLKQFKNFGKER